MSFEAVKQYFERAGLGEKVLLLKKPSATVAQAAEAVGCEEKQIAKTMSFFVDSKPILIVIAGDARVDNKKFKGMFHQKAVMIPADQVENAIGHAVGGVCPFVIHEDVTVYLDVSLKRFARVYPAAGSGNSAVDLSIEELEKHSGSKEWIDVCRDWDTPEETE